MELTMQPRARPAADLCGIMNAMGRRVLALRQSWRGAAGQPPFDYWALVNIDPVLAGLSALLQKAQKGRREEGSQAAGAANIDTDLKEGDQFCSKAYRAARARQKLETLHSGRKIDEEDEGDGKAAASHQFSLAAALQPGGDTDIFGLLELYWILQILQPTLFNRPHAPRGFGLVPW